MHSQGTEENESGDSGLILQYGAGVAIWMAILASMAIVFYLNDFSTRW